MVSRFLPLSQISGRMYTIPLFQISVWCEKHVTARHYADIGIQLWFSNNRNWVSWAVLGLSQDRACTNLFENFRENSLKQNLSNDTTVNPPLFSLVNTFKQKWSWRLSYTKSKKISKAFYSIAVATVCELQDLPLPLLFCSVFALSWEHDSKEIGNAGFHPSAN